MAAAIGDVWQFALRQSLFGQEVINTFALKVTAIPGGTTEAAFMNGLFADNTGEFNGAGKLRPEFLDVQSNDLTHVSWLVHRVDPNPTNVFVFTLTTNVIGLIASTAETANIALSITRKGLDAGRRNRGRIAVAGIPPTSWDQGRFSVNILAEADGIAAQMIGTQTNGAGTSWQMGWWNPYHEAIVNNQPVIYPAKFTQAVSATPQSTVRVQRSRTIGVGS